MAASSNVVAAAATLLNPSITPVTGGAYLINEAVVRPVNEMKNKAKEETAKTQAAVDAMLADFNKKKEDETSANANIAAQAAARRKRSMLPSPTTFTSSLSVGGGHGGKKAIGL